jgi:hypothetical protein
MLRSSLDLVHQRLAGRQRRPVHPHAHPLVVRLDHHALVAHAPHQVERLHGAAPQGELLHVGRHAPLDGRAHLLLDLEEPIRRTEPVQALMRPPVVVVLDPVGNALARLLERLEARPHQELLFERLPEAFDLPQRRRMLRRAAQVVHVVLREFLLKLRLAPPGRVLPPVVG